MLCPFISSRIFLPSGTVTISSVFITMSSSSSTVVSTPSGAASTACARVAYCVPFTCATLPASPSANAAAPPNASTMHAASRNTAAFFHTAYFIIRFTFLSGFERQSRAALLFRENCFHQTVKTENRRLFCRISKLYQQSLPVSSGPGGFAVIFSQKAARCAPQAAPRPPRHASRTPPPCPGPGPSQNGRRAPLPRCPGL